jgi:hypothetical protein
VVLKKVNQLFLTFKLNTMERDIKKVKNFVQGCITSLEEENYAMVRSGYMGDNSGGAFDYVVQQHANKIVDKLTSLGYIYTTNHGHGCKDWRFSKDFEL